MSPLPDYASEMSSEQAGDQAFAANISASVDELLELEWAAMKAARSFQENEDEISAAPFQAGMIRDTPHETETPGSDPDTDNAEEPSMLEIELAIQEAIASSISSPSSDGSDRQQNLPSLVLGVSSDAYSRQPGQQYGVSSSSDKSSQKLLLRPQAQVRAVKCEAAAGDSRRRGQEYEALRPCRKDSQALLKPQASVLQGGDEAAAQEVKLKYRSLCDYELPEGDERQAWDTDFLRLAFGEIEEVVYGREMGEGRGRGKRVSFKLENK